LIWYSYTKNELFQNYPPEWLIVVSAQHSSIYLLYLQI
jgi:hypothetical protein